MTKSVGKIYFLSCATGNLEKLIELVSKYPRLLSLHNGPGKSGLYYSVKNFNQNTTEFLISKGLLIAKDTLRRLIYHWNGSLRSFNFIQKNLFFEIPKEEIIEVYKNHCYSNNRVGELIKILGIEKNEKKLILVINEYKEYKKHNSSPNYLTSIRDIQLEYLLSS